MIANPLLGVLFHWIGGLAAGSFYVPYRGVRRWSWEVYWIVGGVFSWIIAPILFATFGSHDVWGVLSRAPFETLAWCYFFGVLWGFGGLTFGLTMRYLGMSLGMAIALGFSAAIGTLLPPIVSGAIVSFMQTLGGLVTLGGVVFCMIGITIVGLAGHRRERETADRGKAVPEFNLRKGVSIAIFSGVMSSCFSYGLASGDPIRKLSLEAGTDPLMQSLPVLVVVLLGGFTTNFIWSLMLIVRNRTGAQFFGEPAPAPAGVAQEDLPARPPLLRNYALCAAAGVIWYLQFYFYSQGEVQMGRFGFASWTLHMSSIIIFSSLWGFALKEWKGASVAALTRFWFGLVVLIGATALIGLSNLLDA